jgi:hypothetical protein
VSADLLAGSSPTPAVAWFVGRAGTVLLIANGSIVRRVPFPESVDLTAVRASDALTAVVTTADGRSFGTTDGGVTWSRSPR